MPVRYCIWTLLMLWAVPAAAQQSGTETRTTGYTIFVRGMPAGREEVTVVRNETGITLTGKGRFSIPFNVIVRKAEVKYRSDWTPEVLEVDASVEGGNTTLKTTFLGETALAEGTIDGQKISHTDVTSRQPFVLPNAFFGSYEAIVRRLSDAPIGTEYRAWVAPRVPEAAFALSSVSTERMQTGTSTFNVKRYVLTFGIAGRLALVNLYADDNGTLLRLNIPTQGLDVVRDDLAATTARTSIFSNAGDEAVFIAASGFNLGATLTRPRNVPAGMRVPAVVLVGGADVGDRDGALNGIPILGQLAGAIAESGMVALRYDRRGFGQSGGRTESATINDLAEDLRAVVRWLANRRDIDRDRIAVVGHNEGAWVSLLAASREGRIAAAIGVAAPSTTGAERVLEQQQQTLEALKASPEDRTAKIALQNQINAAVISGRGWDAIAPDIRRQADTPWFQSLLAFSPSRVLEDVDQPLLFIHGQLDREVPVSHLDRIADLARTESDSKSVAVVSVRGVNHLLLPAITGEIAEYAAMQGQTISADVTAAITEWLKKTFAAIQ